MRWNFAPNSCAKCGAHWPVIRKRHVMQSYATGLVDFARMSERGVLRVPAVTQRQLRLSCGRCEPWLNFPE
jgi:hypothetical protein